MGKEEEKKDEIPAMSAGPPEPTVAPAGRGRGTALPAWMTSGVGGTSTAAIDAAAPQIAAEAAAKKPEKDLLAETFAERDKTAAARLKATMKGTGQKKKKWTGW